MARPEVEEIRRAAREVLADSVYDRSGSMFGLAESLLDQLTALMRWLQGLPFGWQTAILVVSVGLLVLLVWHIAHTLRGVFRQTPDRWPGLGAERRDLIAELGRRRADAVERGDFNRAIQDAFLEMVLLLDRREEIRFSWALTNRELAGAFRTQDVDPRFVPLVRRVDDYWYGQRQATDRDYRQVADVCREILA